MKSAGIPRARRRRRGTKVLGLMVASLLAPHVGCAPVPVRSPFRSKAELPAHVVVTASPSALGAEGAAAQSGIFCRLYFFAAHNPTPMSIQGEVTIVAYDEEKGSKEHPEGLYRIEGEEVDDHLRRDVVGDSYVFWLPFNVAETRNVVLIASLKSAEGETLASTPVRLKVDPPGASALLEDDPPPTAKRSSPGQRGTDQGRMVQSTTKR